MKIILVRHGETLENIQNIMQGHWHGTLSEKGVEQTKKLGLYFKNEKIDLIYSSDLLRATKTAHEIANYHKNTKIIYLKDLREMFLGDLQGKQKLNLKLYSRQEQLDIFKKAGAETLQEMYNRAKNFLKFVIKNHQKQTVVAVGHNGINKSIIAALTGKKAENIPDIENQKNTAFNIIEIKGNNSKILKYNCIEHL